MRKVLLATTALVAVNVTAAQAADIAISGAVDFEMSDTGAATTYNTDSNVMITATDTTDAGLSTTAAININGASTTGSTTEDAYIDLAGEFGSVRMGNTDDALDRMDGAIPSNFDHQGVGQTATAAAIGGDSQNISFMAPSMGGATVYGTTTAEGDMTGMGINYSNSGITVMYQAGQDGQSDETAVAANVAMAGVTVGFGQVDVEVAGAKTKYRSMGAKYTMGAADFRVTSQKVVGGNKYSSIGVKYTIAPGLSVVLESGEEEDQSATFAQVEVEF